MTIESVIREQRAVIEGLWWQSAREWCADTHGDREVLVRQLGDRLAAICDALETGKIPSRGGAAQQVKESALLHNLSPQLIWEYALIERCVYQAWSMARGGWPPESEGKRLRDALLSTVSVIIEQISEEMMCKEHQNERRALDVLERAAEAALDDEPAAGIHTCLSAVRSAFGERSIAALLLFDGNGTVVERAVDGYSADAMSSIDTLAWEVSHDSDVVEVPVDGFRWSRALSLAGMRTLVARSLPLAGDRRGALLIGLEHPAGGPVRRLLGTVADRLAHVLDILERHHAANDELHRLSDERSLRERFVAALAHDLRGPLAAAKLSLDVVLKNLSRPDLVQSARRAVQSIARADGMMRDLLDASRVRAGQPLPLELAGCDLRSLVQEIVDELAPQYGPRFNVQVEPGIAGVWCARELRRALWNLLMNAIRHGSHERPIVINGVHEPTCVRLTVQNEGPAISHDALDRIFDPYQRVGGDGWGLGLTLVRACAEAHGGSVSVSSGEGGPTTFTIRLPFDSRPYYNELMRRSDATLLHEVAP
jgi:signal transduction histidine kinase